MSNLMLVPKPSDLEQFINFLFEGLDGYMYVVAKQPDNSESWDQVFFEYPAQVPTAIKAINAYSATQEIYLAPALFKSKNALKENVKVTQVLWCDFDGNTPASFELPPSMIIRSSEPGHEHVYWKLDTPVTDIPTIEDYNRRLCYKFGADNSGWDANQVLRPPFTINHKRKGVPVGILQDDNNTAFNIAVFDDLAPAPEKSVDYSLWEKLDLPSLNDVIYANKFGPDFKSLFEKQKAQIEDRSTSLTHMAMICAEAQLNDKEIYVIISHLADRWEKFKHHTAASRARQLMGIIEHARIKHPHSNYNDMDEIFEYSPLTLLQADIKVEWAIENVLMKNGVMILAGPSGIGKSQFSIQYMAHLAMGKNFMHYKIDRPQKIGFLSLEMGDMELKHMLTSMYPEWQKTCSPTELSLLNENLKLIPVGESLPMNASFGQDVMLQYIENNDWDGVFIDSIGSAILGNISSSETVQSFTNFNDKIRKRYGIFLWYIHHFRKPAPGTKSYGGQEDLFGDQYLTARATSVYTITKGKDGLLRVRNPKNRHAAEEAQYLMRRVEGLNFQFEGHEGVDSDGLEPLKEQVNQMKQQVMEQTDQTPQAW